jgi:cytochrome c oxidase subunit 2
MTDRRRVIGWLVLLGGSAVLLTVGVRAVAQEQAPTTREFTVSARKFAFSPNRIEVHQGDIVRVTLQADDIAHSFTIDDYRIAKRAAPGQPVTFEFRADRTGTFRFYCNLRQEDGCKDMLGELVVR